MAPSSAGGVGAVADRHYGRDDYLNGVQEVIDVEGPILNLSFEIVDLGQEYVDIARVSGGAEQVDDVADEVLELGEDLTVDHHVANLGWFVHVEASPTLFESEGVPSPSLAFQNLGVELVGTPLHQVTLIGSLLRDSICTPDPVPNGRATRHWIPWFHRPCTRFRGVENGAGNGTVVNVIEWQGVGDVGDGARKGVIADDGVNCAVFGERNSVDESDEGEEENREFGKHIEKERWMIKSIV